MIRRTDSDGLLLQGFEPQVVQPEVLSLYRLPYPISVSVYNENDAYYKVLPRTSHEGPEEEQRYNSTISLTLAPDGDG